MKAIERLFQYLDYKDIKHTRFEKNLKLSNGYLGTQLKRKGNLGEDILNTIIDNSLDLNPVWLLTGHGEMLKVNTLKPAHISHKGKFIPLIPIEAMAGYGNGETQIAEADITEGYVIPEFEEKGVRYLIRVSGSSMYPKYSNGDLLGCKPISDLSFFQWGKPYVLDTNQGPLVKRLFPVDNKPDLLLCKSDNYDNYPPFSIHKSSIYRIAIIVGVLRME